MNRKSSNKKRVVIKKETEKENKGTAENQKHK